MTEDEYETISLIDLEGFTQEQFVDQMEIARTTVQAIYQSAGKKLADFIVHGYVLIIDGGDYRICDHENNSCGSGCCQRHYDKECTKDLEGK